MICRKEYRLWNGRTWFSVLGLLLTVPQVVCLFIFKREGRVVHRVCQSVRDLLELINDTNPAQHLLVRCKQCSLLPDE